MKNDPKDIVAFYLQRINNTAHPIEKRIIKNDLFLYYYRLTPAECEAVKSQMQLLLDEKQQELESNDPLLKRAGELLHRLEIKPVSDNGIDQEDVKKLVASWSNKLKSTVNG